MATKQELLQWSFIATLVGGVVILVNSLTMSLFMAFTGDSMMGGMFGGRGMWDDDFIPNRFLGLMVLWMLIWGLLAGGAAIFAALRIRSEPERATTWGTVAIVAGAVSLAGMGGGILGAGAAIAGGALAIVAAGRDGERRSGEWG